MKDSIIVAGQLTPEEWRKAHCEFCVKLRSMYGWMDDPAAVRLFASSVHMWVGAHMGGWHRNGFVVLMYYHGDQWCIGRFDPDTFENGAAQEWGYGNNDDAEGICATAYLQWINSDMEIPALFKSVGRT